MPNSKCPKCGSTMKIIHEPSSVAWVCTHCDYSEATTESDALHSDETIYSIILLDNDLTNLNVIKALSKFTGLNYIQTKNLISNPKEIARGFAYEILEKKEFLDSNEIHYRIFPEFNY